MNQRDENGLFQREFTSTGRSDLGILIFEVVYEIMATKCEKTRNFSEFGVCFRWCRGNETPMRTFGETHITIGWQHNVRNFNQIGPAVWTLQFTTENKSLS